eukprot:TRINITY_DN2354_c0_g1_i10.p1 TRINITY_DN2354_c0_g1~~TRINITY_DN2354_c0_g1_i10.p1  ORF type:complete len:787 (-),score=136.35 TRINITY_DN2354_c0_g1_i10:1170-3530(-)
MENDQISVRNSILKKYDYLVEIMRDISTLNDTKFLLDTLVITKDEKIWTHSLILGAISPFLKALLSTVDDYEEHYVLHLPDVSGSEVSILLQLLYSGCADIYTSELDNIKSLTGMLKMISIPVTMSKQKWMTRKTFDSTSSKEPTHLSDTFPSTSNKDLSSKEGRNEQMVVEEIKSNSEPQVAQRFEKASSSINVYTKPNNLSSNDIQLIRPPANTSELDRYNIINDFAVKHLKTLFDDAPMTIDRFSASFEDYSTKSKQDLSSAAAYADHVTFEESSSHVDDIFATDDMKDDDRDAVKEIQVFVSGDNEVTALEVLRDEEEGEGEEEVNENGNEPSDNDVVEDMVKNFNDGSVEKTIIEDSSNLDFDVHQISSLNPDAPFVISSVDDGDGVIGLISVTEAFENSHKSDFNDISNTTVEGTETKTLIRKCPICQKSVLGLHAFGRHMKSGHPKLFGPYTCPWPNCGRTQEDGAKLLCHITQQHSKSSGTGEEIKKEREIKCNICNIFLSSKEFLRQHSIRFHGIKEDDLALPAERQVFLCSPSTGARCTQKFRTCRSYVNHMKNVHKEKPWLCDECGKRFGVKQNYEQHSLLHGEKRSFVCDLCNKSYATPRLLYTHRSLHRGRRFPCHLCSFVGRSSSNLRGHKINVHGERKLACKVCNRKFALASNLQDHMRIHTGETPFSCELCDMSYKRKHHLTCHIRSKAHMDMIVNCSKLGIKIPPELDPDQPAKKCKSIVAVDDGILSNETNFETHIAEMEADQQVLIFEPCEELEPYIIQETEEVVVM